MRSPVTGVVSLLLLFFVLIVGYSSVFTVAQTEQVLLVRLGEPIRVVTDPGLNFKAPFIDTVISIAKRILDLENPSQEVIAFDVRIRRADLPEQNSQAVYQRMQTERQREAAEFRAQGGQKAQEIRSNADREATVIVAEANSTSEQVRGAGDAERNRLFAEAYGKDPDFFAFYRSMSAYENGLKSNDTRFLLRPDSDFFKFFGSSSGKPPAAATPPAAAAAAPKP